MKKILFFLVIILAANLCFAQEKKDEPFVVPAESWACENNPLGFDSIHHEAKQENNRVIAIFRAGKDETETVNSKRLAYVKKIYLQEWAEFNNLEVVYVLGEKTKDEGKIEFYVGGRLSFVIIAPKIKLPV